ncbi:hypothetical protein ANN_17692 [Periplaneta americana]|uniref:Uncharacterized protein n=1 Tax=Periplaneta americana TaxID=6978 RepID=A0ABQ8STS5_PERAM|nr:hypothetical protein ANN_17692 [Periplaneta americana]
MESYKRINTLKIKFPATAKKPSAYEIHQWLVETMRVNTDQVDTIQLHNRDFAIYLKLVSVTLYNKLLNEHKGDKMFKYESGEEIQIVVSAADIQSTTVRIFNLPPEIPNIIVSNILSKYGQIHDRSEKWNDQYPLPVNNGVKAVKMDIKIPIPTLLKIGMYTASLNYPGQIQNQTSSIQDSTAPEPVSSQHMDIPTDGDLQGSTEVGDTCKHTIPSTENIMNVQTMPTDINSNVDQREENEEPSNKKLRQEDESNVQETHKQSNNTTPEVMQIKHSRDTRLRRTAINILPESTAVVTTQTQAAEAATPDTDPTVTDDGNKQDPLTRSWSDDMMDEESTKVTEQDEDIQVPNKTSSAFAKTRQHPYRKEKPKPREETKLGPQYNSIVNVGDSNRGTAIIYRSGLSIQLYEQHQSGRITSLLLNTGVLIVNLYLPSGSNNRVLREQMIAQDLPFYLRHKYNILILGGDFNNVLNARDQKGEYHPSPNLQRLCNELQLLDAWEVVHGNNVQFTFHRGQAASRLDRIYVNKQLKHNILNAQVQPAVFSDHHALLVKMEVDNTIPPHGRGYWKLNESLLYDDKIKEEFMLRWKAADKRANNRALTNIQKWLTIYKPTIRSFFKYVGIGKARERKNMSEFYYRLLQELLMKQRAGQDVDAEIKNIKTKIVQIQEYIMDGIKIRSRTTSVADDERGSLYHLASEKSKGSNKYIHSLTSGDDGLITSTKDIMHQAEIHFTQLFATKQVNNDEQDKVLDYVTSSLSDEEASSLTQPITSEEILLALKTASSKSAPGPDGIGYNFYKIYWNIIKEPLTKLFNELLHATRQPMGFNEGIIILIPKLSQAQNIQDYRLITLLNTDCKLFAKLIANRIRFHLKDLIGEEQTCGIPGRKITDNLEALRDTVFYFDTNRHESAGLLSLDFQKHLTISITNIYLKP